MKFDIIPRVLVLAAILLLTSLGQANAQSSATYEIVWATFDGGGSESSVGNNSLLGSVASPAGTSSGASVQMVGGYVSGAATDATAVLSVGDALVDTSQPLIVPVTLNTNGSSISSVAFTLKHDVNCFVFDNVDSEPDGIPDNVTLLAPSADFQLGADTAAQGVDEVRVVVSPKANDPLPLLSDGDIASVTLDPIPGCSIAGVSLIDLSAGNDNGQSSLIESSVPAILTFNQPPVAYDDDISADEDNGATGSVFADNGNGADYDPDGDPFTVSAVDGIGANVGVQSNTFGFNVPFTLNSDGSFSYIPGSLLDYLSEGETANDSFSYEITDGLLGGGPAAVNVTVDGVNDTPSATIDNLPQDGAIQLTPGELFAFSGTHSDVDQSDLHDVTVFWGDSEPDYTSTGLNPLPSNNVSTDHTYAAPGLYDLTFTATDNRTLNNTATDTEKVAVGSRGDCNGDTTIDAGDLPAWVLEFFDSDDNADWLQTVLTPIAGQFPGNPIGCDTNANTNIDVPDLVCTIKKVLVGAGEACTVSAASVGGQARLTLPDTVSGATGETVQVPVTLESGGNDIAAAVFSIDLAGMSFDAADGNGDGLPDALALAGDNAQAVVHYDARDEGGELDMAIYTMDLTALADGEILTISLQVNGDVPSAAFSAEVPVSLGSTSGASIPVDADPLANKVHELYLPTLSK